MKTIQTWFRTVSFIGNNDKYETEIKYEAKHSNGPTSAATDITLKYRYDIENPEIQYKVDFGEFNCLEKNAPKTPDEALDKLADWMERCAIAIKDRKRGESRIKADITIYNNICRDYVNEPEPVIIIESDEDEESD